MPRHVLTPEESSRGLQKARTPEARARRVESYRRSIQERRDYIIALRSKGKVVEAIADEVGLADGTVQRICVEAGMGRRYGRGVIVSGSNMETP